MPESEMPAPCSQRRTSDPIVAGSRHELATPLAFRQREFLCELEMPLSRFKFPPESYSAIYTSDITSANVVNSKQASTPDGQVSPVSNVNASLFSCFQCAFHNSIKGIPKEKHARKPKASEVHHFALGQRGGLRSKPVSLRKEIRAL
ncbi:jg11791 [Pararge aegeria aegeria]|uniref:Jg11791 protein n=1 Tax=Pararge aegeria aegeria TaxID=348720 RepID=A0A8S4S428_9NEOP|nr:jg11791 [Pararge aegeria aegeria]